MLIQIGNITADLEADRDHEEAMAEAERELNIRIRMFPVWVKSRKLSALDAKDRLERLATAIRLLAATGLGGKPQDSVDDPPVESADPLA